MSIPQLVGKCTLQERQVRVIDKMNALCYTGSVMLASKTK